MSRWELDPQVLGLVLWRVRGSTKLGAVQRELPLVFKIADRVRNLKMRSSVGLIPTLLLCLDKDEVLDCLAQRHTLLA